MAAEATDQPTSETEEQSQTTDDQAGDDTSGVSADGQDSEEGGESEEQALEVLSQEEYDKVKGNPEQLRKALNRAFTQKSQEIASHRRVLEPWVDVISGLETDPRTTVLSLAKQLGINLQQQGTAEEAEERAVDTATQVTNLLTQELGEEYGDLASKLAPAITKVAQMVAAESIKPYARAQEELIRDTSLREAGAAMEAFDKEVPGWRKHEKAMTELSQQLEPKNGMSELQYLRILYSAVATGSTKSNSIKGVLAKMTKAAQTADSNKNSVADNKVTRKATGPIGFAEAASLARQGVRLED